MQKKIESRAYGRELRIATTEKGKTLEGYAAVFNSLSSDLGGFVEKIQPGAFDNTLKKNPDVLALFNHNSDCVLGRTVSDTLTLSIDDKGLRFSCLLPNTTIANDLAVSVDRGDISGCSFGFVTESDSWETQDNGTPLRTLEQVQLIEVTVTPMPAYPDTSVALRSAKLAFGDTFPCACPCAQCRAGACNICSQNDCKFLGCKCPENNSNERSKTKTVDGHSLTADCFLIVLDPDKTDTWNLPWKFPTEEETKSHLRDALARFDQLKDVPADVKDKAYKRLVELCKEHGITVSDDDSRSRRTRAALRLKLAQLRAK